MWSHIGQTRGMRPWEDRRTPFEGGLMAAGRVVVIGAGVAGLTAALAISRTGAEVVIVDRDEPPPPFDDPKEAFSGWPRQQVVQSRQPHNFLARTVLQFREHAPDVLAMLAEHGVEA